MELRHPRLGILQQPHLFTLLHLFTAPLQTADDFSNLADGPHHEQYTRMTQIKHTSVLTGS